jgi:hypothetical protein
LLAIGLAFATESEFAIANLNFFCGLQQLSTGSNVFAHNVGTTVCLLMVTDLFTRSCADAS